MHSASNYKLRFYEKEPTVKFAVEFLFAFPPVIQTILSNSFSQLAVRDYRANHLLKNFKSLGSEKVLALYMLQKKRRTYDQNPSLHQAMGYLMVLPVESQKKLSVQLNELMAITQEYLQICRQFHAPPEKETLEALTQCYVHEGNERAKHNLQELIQHYKTPVERVEKEPVDLSPPARRFTLPHPEAARNTRIQGNNTDLKVQQTKRLEPR